MKSAFRQTAGRRHRAGFQASLPVAASKLECVPIPRNLVVPLHDFADLPLEAITGRGVISRFRLPALDRRSWILNCSRRGLELELLEHVLGRVLQVPELLQPQPDEVVGHHAVLGGSERGAGALELGFQLVELALVDGAGLGGGPERLQQWRRQPLGPEREVVQKVAQVADERRLAAGRHVCEPVLVPQLVGVSSRLGLPDLSVRRS
jgi:hypothetical protein